MTSIPLKYLIERLFSGSWGDDQGIGEHDARCVRVADFDRGAARCRGVIPTVRSYPREEIQRKKLIEGDVLLESSGGGDQQPVGFPVLWEGGGDAALCSNFVTVLRPDRNRVIPAWLAYMLENLYRTGQQIPYIKQTTGIQNLDRQAFLRTDIVVPPLAQQREIVRTLDRETARVDALIDAKERMAAGLRDHWDLAVAAVLIGSDSHATQSAWLPLIGEDRTVRKVKHLAAKVGSGKTPRGGSEVYVPAGVIFLRSQNVHFDGLRLDDVVFIDDDMDREMSGTRIRPHDALLNITGASIGRATYVPQGMERANVNQHVCIIRPIRPEHGEFIAYALALPQVQAQIRATQVGGNRDGLNFEQVRSLEIPVPTSQESLTRIVREARALRRAAAESLDAVTTTVALLREYRRTMMTSVLAGADPRRDAGMMRHAEEVLS